MKAVRIVAMALGAVIVLYLLVTVFLLSEHPKAAIHEHLKSGHTFRRNVQDI
jgi:hypothetical protein